MSFKLNKMPFIITASLFLLATACKNKPQQAPEQKFILSDTMMAQTKFAKATMLPVYASLKLFGKVTADNSRLAQIFPVVGGSVIKVNVELGDYVKKGQILAVMRSGEVAE